MLLTALKKWARQIDFRRVASSGHLSSAIVGDAFSKLGVFRHGKACISALVAGTLSGISL